MPLYDYQCTSCGKTFEVSQRMSDPTLTACICDEKAPVQRLLNAGAGLIFKGSGFYQTDYKNTGASPAKTETKTESKSETPAAPACGQGGCAACSE
jgi:putative FmdB family regulatory protein